MNHVTSSEKYPLASQDKDDPVPVEATPETQLSCSVSTILCMAAFVISLIICVFFSLSAKVR